MTLKERVRMRWELIVSVQTGHKGNLEQIRAFLEASDEVQFEAQDREQI